MKKLQTVKRVFETDIDRVEWKEGQTCFVKIDQNKAIIVIEFYWLF